MAETRWNSYGRFCNWFILNSKWLFPEIKDLIKRKDSKKIKKIHSVIDKRNFLLTISVEAFVFNEFGESFLEKLHYNKGKNSYQLFSLLKLLDIFFNSEENNIEKYTQNILERSKELLKIM